MVIKIKESHLYRGATAVFAFGAAAAGIEAARDFVKHDIIESIFTAWGSLLSSFIGVSTLRAARAIEREEKPRLGNPYPNP